MLELVLEQRVYRLSGSKKRNPAVLSDCGIFGGDGEIRTLDTLLGYTRFPIVRARPATRHLHIVARLKNRLFGYAV